MFVPTLAASAPYRECVLIITPFKSASPQLCRTLATARAPTSSTSDMRSVSMMICRAPFGDVELNEAAVVRSSEATWSRRLVWLGFMLYSLLIECGRLKVSLFFAKVRLCSGRTVAFVQLLGRLSQCGVMRSWPFRHTRCSRPIYCPLSDFAAVAVIFNGLKCGFEG